MLLKNMVGPWGLEPQTSTVSMPLIGFTTTYKTAGTAKVRGSSYKTYFLWVGKSRRTPESPHVFPRTFLDAKGA
jgi:hypothetical protein